MKYAISFYHNDGYMNNDMACSAKERNMMIREAKKETFINGVVYNPILKSGEYGKRTCIVFKRGR